MRLIKLLFILVVFWGIPLFSQSFHYYFYEAELSSGVKMKCFVVTDGKFEIPDFEEITLSEAMEKGYTPIKDSSLLAPPIGYNSHIHTWRSGNYKYAHMWSASSSQQPTIMYLWATSYWKELGSPYWSWLSLYGETFGTYLECFLDLQYRGEITAELQQKGVHTFWVGPNPPPPPPAPRGK